MIYLILILPIVFIVVGVCLTVIGFMKKSKNVIDYDLKEDSISGQTIRDNVSIFGDKIRGAVRPVLCSTKDMAEVYSEERYITYP